MSCTPGTSKANPVTANENPVAKPDLEVAQLRFYVKHPELNSDVKNGKWLLLMEKIKQFEMGPVYELVCKENGQTIDENLLKEFKSKNNEALSILESEIKDAEQNSGESRVRQAWLKKFEYLCQIGDKKGALAAFRVTYEKTVEIGYQIDLVFSMIRLGLFFFDHRLINANIAKAKDLMDKGGDWERKNRLKSYEALYKIVNRDLKDAATLLLETVQTFDFYELLSYDKFILYTIITSVYALDRPDLQSKVMRSNQIQERLNSGGENGELILIKNYLDSFYNCHYDQFFINLAKLENEQLKFDRYFSDHHEFYLHEMRLKSYTLFLMPCIRIDTMAQAFGIAEDELRYDLQNFLFRRQPRIRLNKARTIIEVRPEFQQIAMPKRRLSILEVRGAKCNLKWWIATLGFLASICLGVASLFEPETWFRRGFIIAFIVLLILALIPYPIMYFNNKRRQV